MGETDWLDYGFVVASSHRKAIVSKLGNGPSTPRELSVSISIPISHVSRALSELQNKGLVICLTPTLRKGRVYSLTENGSKAAKHV